MRVKQGTRLVFLDQKLPGEHYNVVRRVIRAEKHAANPVLPLGDLNEWDSLRGAVGGTHRHLRRGRAGLQGVVSGCPHPANMGARHRLRDE